MRKHLFSDEVIVVKMKTTTRLYSVIIKEKKNARPLPGSLTTEGKPSTV